MVVFTLGFITALQTFLEKINTPLMYAGMIITAIAFIFGIVIEIIGRKKNNQRNQ